MTEMSQRKKSQPRTQCKPQRSMKFPRAILRTNAPEPKTGTRLSRVCSGVIFGMELAYSNGAQPAAFNNEISGRPHVI